MLIQPRVWLNVPQDSKGSTRRLRLSAAHNEWNHVGIALAAIEQGFFAEEGLADVELISFPEEQGELVEREAFQVAAIASGAVDIGIDPRTTFLLEANDAGKPVCIVAARRKNHAFVLIGRKDIETLEDLRGQTLFESQPGGATDVMLRQVLTDKGFDLGKDVTIEYTHGPMHDGKRTAEAFRAGKRGPAMLSSAAEVENFVEDGFPVLLDLRSMYPSRHDRVTGANEHFVRDHPDILKAFLRGMIRGCRFVLDLNNTARFKQIMLDAGFLTSEREQVTFDNLFIGWQTRGTRDLELPRDGIELIVNEQKRAGKLAPGFNVDDVLRLDTLRQVQQELAEA